MELQVMKNSRERSIKRVLVRVVDRTPGSLQSGFDWMGKLAILRSIDCEIVVLSTRCIYEVRTAVATTRPWRPIHVIRSHVL
jgi:hypothetical protein